MQNLMLLVAQQDIIWCEYNFITGFFKVNKSFWENQIHFSSHQWMTGWMNGGWTWHDDEMMYNEFAIWCCIINCFLCLSLSVFSFLCCSVFTTTNPIVGNTWMQLNQHEFQLNKNSREQIVFFLHHSFIQLNTDSEHEEGGMKDADESSDADDCVIC